MSEDTGIIINEAVSDNDSNIVAITETGNDSNIISSVESGSDSNIVAAVESGNDTNILFGGAEALSQMKQCLVSLDDLKTRRQALVKQQEQLEKDIAAKQKQMDSEISTTVSKRQAEIEQTFDSQVDETRSRIKMVRSKRDKLKDTKVSERISVETAGNREEIRSLKQDLKGLFSREHVSHIFNNEYFFSVYMPDGIGDFLIILLSVIIVLAIPAAVFFLLPAKLHTVWMLFLLYAALIALTLGIFTLVFKNVRNKHIAVFRKAKEIRDEIHRLQSNINKQEKSIRKDKDESGYGLEKFDEEMSALDNRIDEIIEEKKQALKGFEAQTKGDIIGEITSRHSVELDSLRGQNEQAYEEQRTVEEQIKTLSLEISTKYEAYIGKENLSVSTIDSLIEFIEAGDASNVAEALSYYKKLLSESKKEQ